MRLQTLLSAHEILHTRQQWRPDWSRKHHSLELAILNRIAALELAEKRLKQIEALPKGWVLKHSHDVRRIDDWMCVDLNGTYIPKWGAHCWEAIP